MKTLNRTFATRFLMLLFLGISLTGIFSCNNDDDKSEPSTMELLTSGRWYLQSSTILTVTACDREKYFDFSNDGSLILLVTEMVDGTCTNHPLQNFTFELTTENNIIINQADGESTMLEIASITQNSLVLRQSMTDGGTHDLIFDKTAG